MEACEKALAVNPDHPAALVYHGIGLLAESKGNPEVFPKALGEMHSPPELEALMNLEAAAPLRSDDSVREAVRRLLRHIAV